jgi:flagellar biosynthetic protein FliR
MDHFFEQLAADPWGRLVLRQIATGGLWNAYVFVLVAARFAGVFLMAPMFTAIAVPYSARVGLVVLLSLIVAPTLVPREVDGGHLVVTAHGEYGSSHRIELPATASDLICAVASEVCLGTLFGVGLIGIFSGLRLGGEWLDRHSGLGLGAVFNPEWSAGPSVCGSFALLLGVAGLLLAEPIGGHWQLPRSLVQSFHAIPVGSTAWSGVSIEFLCGVVQQCLILGIRVAMPLVAAMLLVDVTLAFASRGSTSAETSTFLAFRMGAGMVVLAFTMTTIPESATQAMISAVQLVTDFHLP